jgi:hypothetical protein
MGGGLLNPLTYEMVYITPDLFKTGQTTPKAFLKIIVNHRKIIK